MTLKPPFFAQAHENTCAIACLRMILGHYGKEVPEENVLTAETRLEEHGLAIADLASLARRYGLIGDIMELNLAGIETLVSEGKLPIVFIERQPLDGEDSFHAVIPFRITDYAP